MGKYVKVIPVADFPQGSMKTVIVMGKKIAVARIGDEYFAIDDLCSHAQCSLGEDGFLEHNVVTCGCHGAQFDVTNGKVLSLPAVTDVSSYPVKIDKGDLFVQL